MELMMNKNYRIYLKHLAVSVLFTSIMRFFRRCHLSRQP